MEGNGKQHMFDRVPESGQWFETVFPNSGTPDEKSVEEIGALIDPKEKELEEIQLRKAIIRILYGAIYRNYGKGDLKVQLIS